MSKRTRLQPKVQNRLKVSTTLIYGGSAFLLTAILFGAGFFYLNLGNNESAKAANMAVVNYSFGNGNWTESNSWSSNFSPVNGQKVVISAGHTVSIIEDVDFNGVIDVYGTLEIQGGNLSMDNASSINFHIGSKVIYSGKKDGIRIEKSKWNVHEINNLEIPNILTASGAIGAPGKSVELVGFVGDTDENNNVILKWQTIKEQGNDKFTIERSVDNEYFESIVDISGQGDYDKLFNYRYTDTAPYEGENYYRLKQLEVNGKYEYLKTVQIVVAATKFDILSVDPNEEDQTFNISFKSNEGQIELALTSRQGEKVYEEIITANRGLNEFELQKLDLPHGMYTLTMRSEDDGIEHKRFIFITSTDS